MTNEIQNFGPEFSDYAQKMINYLARVRKAMNENNGLIYCLECDFYRRTDQPFTQYWCANEKTPIRKGDFEEFQNMACPMGRKKVIENAENKN